MKLDHAAKHLQVHLGESDRVKHTSLHEVLIRKVRRAGLAGATVWRGLPGFGPTSRIRSERILDLPSDLSGVGEIVDTAEKIERFLPILHDRIEAAGCVGMTTLEDVRVFRYSRGGETGEADPK